MSPPARRVYRPRNKKTVKLRLQHTSEDGNISPLLESISDRIDKRKLVAFRRARLGSNPKYEGRQATAIYLDVPYETLERVLREGGLIR